MNRSIRALRSLHHLKVNKRLIGRNRKAHPLGGKLGYAGRAGT